MASIEERRETTVRRFLTVTLIAAALVAIPAGSGMTAVESEGCALLNSGPVDGVYASFNRDSVAFNEGDTIMLTAGTFIDPTRDEVLLFVDGGLVDNVAFPGTVSHTFSATRSDYGVNWTTSGTPLIALVRWDGSCTRGSGGASKVTVCHDGKKTLSVASEAVPAHLNHGDTEGACP